MLQVFSGCFQRSEEVHGLKLKLLEFLYDRKDDTWAHLLTPTSIESLATAIRTTTGLFVASRISMRTQIFSLYANEIVPGRIHSVSIVSTSTNTYRLNSTHSSRRYSNTSPPHSDFPSSIRCRKKKMRRSHFPP